MARCARTDPKITLRAGADDVAGSLIRRRARPSLGCAKPRISHAQRAGLTLRMRKRIGDFKQPVEKPIRLDAQPVLASRASAHPADRPRAWMSQQAMTQVLEKEPACTNRSLIGRRAAHCADSGAVLLCGALSTSAARCAVKPSTRQRSKASEAPSRLRSTERGSANEEPRVARGMVEAIA